MKTAQKPKNQASSKKRMQFPVKFDKEGFFMTWGIGIVCAGIGVLIIWATKTAPEGSSGSMGYTTAQRLARVLPQSTKETLAFILGCLFILFGVFCFFLGLKLVVQYIFRKTNS
ncbi:MAG: hypothetical protein JNK09_17600 [Prolixibacteraceae bacterium]|nr:hypothetical protein [Prolixibacteraceae bacterium]